MTTYNESHDIDYRLAYFYGGFVDCGSSPE